MKKISLCAVLIIMANFAYANDLTKTENYYPDGKDGIGSRFARKNPTIEKVKNNVRLTVHSYDNGPIHMDIHKYGGGIYFERRFEDHPLSEHGGWSRPPVTQQVNDFHGSIENGKLGVTNAKIYGVEMHPNDAYDAKDGGDHPYDIYTFTVDGESRYTSIREVEKPKPLPTPPNNPNQPNKNGDNGDKGNQSEPNDSRNDKVRQDSADNSPDLANNNNGEVPLPYNYYPNGITEADIFALRLSPPPPFTEYDDGTKNNTNTANNYPTQNNDDWQPENFDSPLDLNALELSVGLGGVATDILTSIKGRSDSSVDSSIKLALTGDQKAIDNLEAASIISAEQANALRKAAANNQIDDFLKNTNKLDKTKVNARQNEKAGDFETAKQDFYSLKPTNVQKRDNGTITGTLADGRDVNVRLDSREGRPTLEIQNTKNNYTKIRYGSK